MAARRGIRVPVLDLPLLWPSGGPSEVRATATDYFATAGASAQVVAREQL
jgi:hypothetical protein